MWLVKTKIKNKKYPTDHLSSRNNKKNKENHKEKPNQSLKRN